MFGINDQNRGTFHLLKDDKTGIATLCINNPSKRNAINDQMMEQLSHVMSELEQWQRGKALIIYGMNGFFSSGVDLNTVRKNMNSLEAGYHYSRLMYSNLSRLQSLPLLTIALIEGKALGGGAEILTACDFRVMTTSAQIGFVQICVGVAPGWSGATRLYHIIGYTKALEILISGRLITSDEAMRLGFINHIFETSDRILDKTKEWLTPYINYDYRIIRNNKQIINESKNTIKTQQTLK